MDALIPLALVGLILMVRPAWANTAPDLLTLSLDALTRVTVVSAGGRPSPLADTPAAVHVITADDIRRSGARDLPELLREAPGVDVARVDGSTWAISARGFNNRFSNKLLVLVDGRSMFNPFRSGVYWDTQNLPLDDVERIEVIRGPGGMRWGANAVNGVINVITRPAADTLGTRAGVDVDDRGGASTVVRQGVALSDGSYLRVDAKAFREAATEPAAGSGAHDAWEAGRTGFRWDRGSTTRLTLEGDLYRERVDYTLDVSSLSPPATALSPDQADVSGGHLRAAWTSHRESGDWRVLGYMDRAARDDLSGSEQTRTYDAEVQHSLPPAGRHRLTWGAGVSRVLTDASPTVILSLDPRRQVDKLWNAFAEDRVALGGGVDLIVGTKVERLRQVGVQWEPGAKLFYRPAKRHAVWVSAARAVEVPARVQTDGRVVLDVAPGTPPTVTALLGNPTVQGARLVAFEAGYRGRPADHVLLDAAGFLNRYTHLSTVEPGTPFFETDPAPAHLLIPLRFDDRMTGRTVGFETSGTWRASPALSVTASYSLLRMFLRADVGSADTTSEARWEGSAPQQHARLAVRADLRRGVELDAAVAWVDELPAQGVPAYARLDLRLGWHPLPGLTLSLAGRNLLDPSHPEFGQTEPDPAATEMPRLILARATWSR